MTGIYKITNPKARVYIGQAVNLEKRRVSYKRLECKGQPRLYASLVKYGFSEHIFEVIEECTIEELNVRERHWQDFYEVLSERGLNCRLQGTEDKSGHISKETIAKQLISRKAFLETPQGKESLKKSSIKSKAFYKTPEGLEVRARQVANTDYPALQAKKVANMDYTAFQKKRLASRDEAARARKAWIPICQFTKDGTFIREWSSGKEASRSLNIHRSAITNCLKGRNDTAKGFIWEYKNK